ncbi:hypothetical protein E2562_022853 [Oryza meyeriana var. granulata]|uniref:UspA domain-containing protein n=1 Tax=Oryza meyeriana var. granulata TaxID=110450 RepID=A0A6G1BPJ8_9ORYZ|nr:hypothetical protein E2562_022853 [Oryza meyeriana var. granulata]
MPSIAPLLGLSYYALQWTLRHFFTGPGHQQYRLVVVNAKPTAASAVGLAGPGAADVLPFVEADLKKSSMRVIEKAKELCSQSRSRKRTAELLPTIELDLKRGAVRVLEKAKEMCSQVIDASYEVLEGDARNVLCEAVDRYRADVLVVGSHGYGAWKRAVLGGVSDYCSHHAHCTVMIVKRPKHKTHS